MVAHIRKALIAGAGAALAAAVGALVEAGSITEDTVAKAIGVGVAAGVSVGWATWRVPNRTQASR